jgi:menaquinone-dependent protoporphyrinogen oxidase
MSKKVGILYATVDGHTRKISNEIKSVLEESFEQVSMDTLETFDTPLEEFDLLIIGSSIRYGVHNEDIIKFINANEKALNAMNTAFFSVNLVARKPEKNTAETNPYVVKFFKKINWKPTVAWVFAGMLDYQKYTFFDRMMIRLIMWITKGPTDPKAKIEYTDWNKVKEFANSLKSMV